jgi:flavodoxin I
MSQEHRPYRITDTPDLLIGYTGNQHLEVASYKDFLDHWAKRLERDKRFGVLLVYEEHQHDHDETRDADEEDAFTRLMGDFRRNHRAEVNRLCTGFARVFPAAWLDGMDEAQTAQYEDRTSRHVQYVFGVRGKNFTRLDEAKAWLESLVREVPLTLEKSASTTPSSIGFYYGSTTGTTELVAEKMQRFASLAGIKLQPVNIAYLKNPQELLGHDQLILGIPTWNVGQLQDDWLLLFPKLDALNFAGKQVALFGVGDQQGYPDNFLDALGMLGHKLIERGATLVGYWPAKDYSFTSSKALVGDQFIGLGLDEYNQEDKTDGRIASWLGQVYKEFSAAKEAVSQ